MMQKIIPHVWFDSEAEEAATFYASLFPGSERGRVTRYGKEGFEQHGQPEGKVMTAYFALAGYEFIALNGGPIFKLDPSLSFFVGCASEEQVNRLWVRLLEKGQILMPITQYPLSHRNGCLQDRYGLSCKLYRKSVVTEKR